MAVTSGMHEFQHRHYAILIWPTALMMMLVLLAYAQSYSRRYDSEAALLLASNTDPMTGLNNRRHFMPTLRQEVARVHRMQRPSSLLMIDIDQFKLVNDVYGHPTGDAVICQVADQSRKVSRQIDTVARMGGEEFAILLSETGLRDACLVAERLRASIASSSALSPSGVMFQFTVSVGVAELSPGTGTEETLIANADEALLSAKAAGRNRVEPAPT
jgi:diguanylate cyclase (GGDEF)-like protein